MATWHPAALNGAYQRALGDVGGYAAYTRTGKVKAILSIGRVAGLSLGKYKEGQRIPARTVLETVIARRMKQIDPKAVAATTFDVTGHYIGQKEPSMRIELVWTPNQEKTATAFYRSIKSLAQDVATKLAQREVLVEWDAPKRRGRVETATPTQAPAATSAAFCPWVRKHSASARTNRNDPCFKK